MKTIVLLSEKKAQNTHCLLAPLNFFKEDLKAKGIKIRRVPFMHPIFFIGADEVWINSKNFRNLWGTNEPKIEKFFKYFQQKNIPVKYFDTGDSAGVIQHGALAHVKFYYKFFLYKNRDHYLKRLYGNRLFTDYYHREFKISDPNQSEHVFKALSIEDSKKLKVFWGPSSTYLCREPKEANFVADKKIPFSSRFHQSYGRPTVAFQRVESAKILSRMGIDCGKIDKEKFLYEMKNSQISYSPFGWGEFAFRDYEALINQTLLIKPDMSEIETWPEIYQDKKTYVPVNWDLKNLESVINHYKENVAESTAIAKSGRVTFQEQHTGAAAMKNYFERVLSVIND